MLRILKMGIRSAKNQTSETAQTKYDFLPRGNGGGENNPDRHTQDKVATKARRGGGARSLSKGFGAVAMLE